MSLNLTKNECYFILLRQIIVLRHVNGLSWRQVAREIGGGNTADSVRKMHDRFLKGVKAG